MLRGRTNRRRQPGLQQARLLKDDTFFPDPEIGPVIRRPDLLIRDSEGETLLYDPVSGRAHWLNATAAVIWDLIDGVATKADLAGTVVDLFSLESEEAAAGVNAVVDDLAAEGLLGEARGPQPSGGAGHELVTQGPEVGPSGPRFLGVPPNL